MEEIDEIENLLNRLDSVRESFEEVESKEEEIQEKEKEIVSEVLSEFKPIVRFVGKKQKKGYSHPGGQYGQTHYDRDDEPSIYLFMQYKVDDEHRTSTTRKPPKSLKDGDQNRGYYTGYGYFLFEEKLIERKYDGNWSSWQKEASSWNSKEITSGEKAIGDMLEAKDVVGILKTLKERVEETREENENKQKYLGKRMKTLDALESVLDL